MGDGGAVERAFTGILAICAIAMTLMVARRELQGPSDPSEPRPPVMVKDWRGYAVGDLQFGPEAGAVTLVEFSDFQCPYCKKFYGVLAKLRLAYPMDLRVVFRNFPIEGIHPFARSAAVAAQCAAEQGRFEQYHDFLFEHQDSLKALDMVEVASKVNVADTSRFRSCLGSERAATRLREDSLAGEQFKLTGTPTVMVNGWRFTGTPTQAQVESLLVKLSVRGR